MLSNEQLLEMWSEDMAFNGKSARTVEANLEDMRKFFKTVDKPASDVTKRIVEGYLFGMTKQNGEKLNISTKSNTQSHIKNFFNWLYRSDEQEIESSLFYIDDTGHRIARKNPVENWESVLSGRDAKAERNPRKQGLTAKEASLFLKTVKDHAENEQNAERKLLAYRDYAMVMLMIELGLRSSDVIALNKSNFDFGFGKKSLSYVVQKTKDRKNRDVSDTLADALMNYWDMRDDDNDIAFASSGGKRLANQNINKQLKKYADMAGIEKPMSCHILRHTCGTLVYIGTGGDIVMTKEVLGHKSINVTQIYTYSEEISNKISKETTNVTNKLVANW